MRVSLANRGMSFEQLVEYTNRCYFLKGMADIRKVATPVKVLRISKGRIRDGFFEKKSTVDFIGVSHGRAIAFDAKSTRNQTRFPLSNIEPHQMAFLKSWRAQGAITFFLVEFAKKHEVYLLRFSDAEKWWEEAGKGGRKSIPYEWFVQNCDLVRPDKGIPLHYLKCLG